MSRNVFGVEYSSRELRRREAQGKGAANQVARGVAGAYTKPTQAFISRLRQMKKAPDKEVRG